jgi:hypothetical protein
MLPVIHRLDIPIEVIGRADHPDVENIPDLVAGGIGEMNVGLCEVGVISGDLDRVGQLGFEPRASKGLLAAAEIVERRVVLNLDRMAVKGDETLVTSLVTVSVP